jgi:hypothetical protein
MGCFITDVLLMVMNFSNTSQEMKQGFTTISRDTPCKDGLEKAILSSILLWK